VTQMESEPRVGRLERQGSDVDKQARKISSALRDCRRLGDQVG
jgi:hypothetical protein